MKTVEKICDALGKLSNGDLQKVEAALIAEYRKRRVGIVFDDAYGVLTEMDMASNAAETWKLLDQEEKVRTPTPRPHRRGR